MFLIVNMMLVAGVVILVLVIAAIASIPGHHHRGPDALEAEWIRPASLSDGRRWGEPAAQQTALPPEVAAAGMQ